MIVRDSANVKKIEHLEGIDSTLRARYLLAVEASENCKAWGTALNSKNSDFLQVIERQRATINELLKIGTTAERKYHDLADKQDGEIKKLKVLNKVYSIGGVSAVIAAVLLSLLK